MSSGRHRNRQNHEFKLAFLNVLTHMVIFLVFFHLYALDLDVHDVDSGDGPELNIVVFVHSVEVVERIVVGCRSGRVVDGVVGACGCDLRGKEIGTVKTHKKESHVDGVVGACGCDLRGKERGTVKTRFDGIAQKFAHNKHKW